MMAMWANAHRDPDASSEYKPQDFQELLPWYEIDDTATDPEAMLEKVRGIHAALSGSRE